MQQEGMLLGGLWHGAAWTFVLWGLFHGVLLIGHRLIAGADAASTAGGAPSNGGGKLVAGMWWLARMVVFFHLVCFGWLLFRASSVGQVVDLCGTILASFSLGTSGMFYIKSIVFYAWFLLLAEIIWFHREKRLGQSEEMPRLGGSRLARAAVMVFSISSVLLFASFEDKAFIYFQF